MSTCMYVHMLTTVVGQICRGTNIQLYSRTQLSKEVYKNESLHCVLTFQLICIMK